ncbi:MAG: AbrB family transcriptional regulator [Methylophaga sp.]|nr:MAG: AbrB family transcriptional regulator [Methylophaga sp.]
MVHLVKIGNSQGIRIPKPFIEQADLEGKELALEVVNGGLFIAPKKQPREGWAASIEAIIASKGMENSDEEWLGATLTSDDDLEW